MPYFKTLIATILVLCLGTSYFAYNYLTPIGLFGFPRIDNIILANLLVVVYYIPTLFCDKKELEDTYITLWVGLPVVSPRTLQEVVCIKLTTFLLLLVLMLI